MLDTDLAWAAGFFDGEGCIDVNGGSPRLTVTQAQRKPLERLQAMFGGSIHRHGEWKGRTSWQWNQHGWPSTRRTLLALLPYLTIKREQGDLVLNASGADGLHDAIRGARDAA